MRYELNQKVYANECASLLSFLSTGAYMYVHTKPSDKSQVISAIGYATGMWLQQTSQLAHCLHIFYTSSQVAASPGNALSNRNGCRKTLSDSFSVFVTKVKTTKNRLSRR